MISLLYLQFHLIIFTHDNSRRQEHMSLMQCHELNKKEEIFTKPLISSCILYCVLYVFLQGLSYSTGTFQFFIQHGNDLVRQTLFFQIDTEDLFILQNR